MRGKVAKLLRRIAYGEQSFKLFEGYAQEGPSLVCRGAKKTYRMLKNAYRNAK